MQFFRRYNYSDFLKEFASVQDEHFNDMFPTYIEKTMAYYQHGDSRLRANAVILVTCLLVEGSHATSRHVNPEFVSNGMAKLLNDSSLDVRIASASHMGKVCIALSHPPTPRLSLVPSDS